MRLRYLFFALALTSQVIAYCPGWWCGPPPGSRERFPRHDVCCENGNCNSCCPCPEEEGECCQPRRRQPPYRGYGRWNGYGDCGDDCCCYDPCGPGTTYVCRWGGSIELGVDALYWSSTLCPITVWNQTSGNPTNFNRSYELKPGYDWGIRGFGQWNIPCGNWFVRGGYLWLRTRDAASLRGVDVTVPWGGLGPNTVASAADAAVKFVYQRAELLAGYNLWNGYCTRFYAYGGGFWMDIDQTFGSQLVGLENQATLVGTRIERKTRAQGVGAAVGFGGQYNVTQGLYLIGRLGGMAVGAERTLRWTTMAPAAVIENGRFNALYPSSWGLFPGIEAKMAARYTAGFCGLWFSGEIGWEIQHYYNAMRTVLLAPNQGVTSWEDCGFSGPYGGLRLRF